MYNRSTNGWAMYFDASDVGISTSDLEDFAIRGDGSILMSFSSSINVPGLVGGPDGTLIDDSDLILFTPVTTGATTSGTFSFYFDGSDVGLETTNERLDGFDVLPDGTLLVSTTGAATVARPQLAPRGHPPVQPHRHRRHHRRYVDAVLRRLRRLPHLQQRRPRRHRLRPKPTCSTPRSATTRCPSPRTRTSTASLAPSDPPPPAPPGSSWPSPCSASPPPTTSTASTPPADAPQPGGALASSISTWLFILAPLGQPA